MSDETIAEKVSASDKIETKEAKPAGRFALWRSCLALCVFFLVLDIVTKLWAISALKPFWWDDPVLGVDVAFAQRHIDVIPGFLRFMYAENTGAAFSILSGKTTFLAIISIVATIGLSVLWYSLPAAERWGRWALALIVSGAIGNGIDRIYRGVVVDFIDAYVGSYHWPTFNIADTAICVGAGILILRFAQGKI